MDKVEKSGLPPNFNEYALVVIDIQVFLKIDNYWAGSIYVFIFFEKTILDLKKLKNKKKQLLLFRISIK